MKSSQLLHSLFVGIDVSLAENVVYVMPFSPEDNPKHGHTSFSVSNTPEGAAHILENVERFLSYYPQITQVVFALEATSVYSYHLATFLSAAHLDRGITAVVYTVNPKETHAYKKTFTDIGKDDYVDAMVIADYARSGKIRSKPWKGSELLGLRVLTRTRYKLAILAGSLKNAAGNSVYLKYSGFAVGEDLPFSNVWTATCQALLTEFSGPADILNQADEELAGFIQQKGHGRFADPLETAQKVKKAARNSYQLDQKVYQPLTAGLSVSLSIIHGIQEAIKALDREIEKLARSFSSDAYQILLSIKGIGPVIAGGILAEIGDIKRFKTEAQLAKYVGLIWKRNQSGTTEGTIKRMSKAGNVYLRYYMMLAMERIMAYSAKYKAAFERIRKRKTLYPYRAALGLATRKLVRLVYVLLDKNQLYSEDKVMVSLE